MAKAIKHPGFPGVTSETNPNLLNADGSWKTPETNPGLFKADGTPRKYVDRSTMEKAPRRANSELLVEYQAKLAKALERHAKEIKGLEKKITYFMAAPSSRAKVDPAAANAAAQDLLGQGLTPEKIIELGEQFRLAMAAFKGKTPEELAALQAPAFLAVTEPELAAV